MLLLCVVALVALIGSAFLLLVAKGGVRVVLYLVVLGAIALFVYSTGFHHL